MNEHNSSTGKDPKVFLKHIFESIEWIEKDIENLTEDQFMENVPIQDAVVRRFEIIGEAVRNLLEEYKEEGIGSDFLLLKLEVDKLRFGHHPDSRGIDYPRLYNLIQGLAE